MGGRCRLRRCCCLYCAMRGVDGYAGLVVVALLCRNLRFGVGFGILGLGWCVVVLGSSGLGRFRRLA